MGVENFRNYYEILGVARDATAEDIKQTFRRLARKCHPDLNPGDRQAEETFKTIGEAYEVLSDPERRSQYDEFSRYWNQAGFQGGKWGRMADRDFGQFPDFNIFVDELLGKQPSPRAGPRDVEANLQVPLERAYAGGLERIRLEDGRAIELDMPGGLVSGQQIRLKGQGIGGGDLYLKIEVPTHGFYRLDGRDIYCTVPVTPVEAVLGAPIEVPTLDGPVQVNVPLGVRAGQRLRLARKGYPNEAGERGDQIVEIAIAVPPQLTSEERSLYEQLYQIERFDPRRDLPI
ncbi:MAG: J domain-containing protein [Synechococcales cyanobacterium CRU_2_2]|nr:J domain-containing protein [Synechococcales cyanobacterium CRU_2_2]